MSAGELRRGVFRAGGGAKGESPVWFVAIIGRRKSPSLNFDFSNKSDSGGWKCLRIGDTRVRRHTALSKLSVN